MEHIECAKQIAVCLRRMANGLRKKNAHIYSEWDKTESIHYAAETLRKLHHQFMHPSTGKLLNLLRRASHEKLCKNTKAILEDIRNACHVCEIYSSKPVTFKVRMPNEILFNREVRLDLMFLKGKPVLHVVDRDTNFSAARFLPSQSSEAIWNTFLYCWVTVYTGYPLNMLTDKGTAFCKSEHWQNRCQDAETTLRHTGVESHNSLGSGETYHALLRRIYNKVSMSNPNFTAPLCLSPAVKAINDTAGPGGLVPSLLLFGTLPRLRRDHPDKSSFRIHPPYKK